MAVRVRQQSYIGQPVAPVLPRQQPSNNPVIKKKFITTKEKFLYIGFVVLVSLFAVFILHKQSLIQQTTIEIQQVQSEISEIENQNGDLKVQVSELSTYERIWEKAKALGLTLNEKNVKVVPAE